MQQTSDKQFTDFREGLITEAGFLNSPEGSTVDEANFFLQIDGSRKRRRGLDLESGGSQYTLPETLATSDYASVGRFKNAGGDADNDYILVQLGSRIHIYKDTGNTLTTQKETDVISLDAFGVDTATYDPADYPVQFASGAGVCVVVGRYIEPFYISYDSVTDTFETTLISIWERDFHTIPEDGVLFETKPTSLTDAHEYNLRNRGWKAADITEYNTDESEYPALGMLWYKGYRRQQDGTATFIDEDGIKDWNSDKIKAEPFGNASAPTGSLLRSPFDTTVGVRLRTGSVAITGDWTFVDGGSTWTVTLNTDTAHGLTHPANFTIEGNTFRYTEEDPEPGPPAYRENVQGTLDGTYATASVVDTDTITFVFNEPFGWDSWDDQYETNGVLFDNDNQLSNPLAATGNGDGYQTDERPTAVAAFAGRFFYAGTKYSELADTVFFTNIVRTNATENKYGECFQMNDPTDEIFNQLLPNDGGTIIINDMGRVQRMLPYNGSLLVFTDEGVWEISGSRGVFTADNYNVRKVTDYECEAPESVIIAESKVFYTGNKGCIRIEPDPRTGILYGTNISENKVAEAWNDIPQVKRDRVFSAYDDANKQLYFLYSSDSGDTYKHDLNRALIYDLRLDSWFKFTFPSAAANYIMCAIGVKDADTPGTYNKIKFFVQTSTRTLLDVCDLEQTDFVDFDGNEEDGYLTMAYDNIGSWAHRRQAPIVHTYCAKTETGYTAGLDPVNPSSVTMQARWDWSDHANANEFGESIEVYRHVRAYTPPDSSDPFNDGYPVVFTRNKVRGRGRALQLRFSTTDTYDAHLLGYHIQYKVGRRI